MKLAEKCKKIRQICNLSQTELGEIIGTNQTAISFIERGFIPPQNVIIKIKQVYKNNLRRK